MKNYYINNSKLDVSVNWRRDAQTFRDGIMMDKYYKSARFVQQWFDDDEISRCDCEYTESEKELYKVIVDTVRYDEHAIDKVIDAMREFFDNTPVPVLINKTRKLRK